MKINKEWHEKNKMPKKATLEQRVNWHYEHAKICGCRGIPPKLQELVKNYQRNQHNSPK